MCGIVGSVNFNKQTLDKNLLTKATDLIKQRGPDDVGYWQEEECSLAHRRLSIIDLSPSGHQPMISSNQRYVCAFNGEIYNYQKIKSQIPNISWRGSSDTEVLLEAWSIWGVKTLDMLDGMFAFAIWDRKEKKIVLARDRIGEKPLYYYYNGFELIFASRPSPIFAMNPAVSKAYDHQALRFFLESGYVPAPHSIHSDIKKLPAAHYLEVTNNKLSIHAYWNLLDIAPDYSWNKRSENDLLDELEELFLKNVKLRMISDVPLGAFLSGGIDSSLVVAMMQKQSTNPIQTFTIGFQEKSYDESSDAEKISKHIGTNHRCEYLKVDDLLSLFPTFMKNFDEPFFDSAAFPTMAVSRLARKHVTVAITGDGGDEFFGGYHYYKIAKYLNPFFKLNSGLRFSLSQLVKMIPKHQFQLLAAALKQPNISSAFAFSRSIAKDFNSVLDLNVLNNTQSLAQLFSARMEGVNYKIHAADEAMRLDALFTLNDDYLQKTDVASMAFSLESRAPILSKEIMEWSLKLPMKWKLKNNENKYLLRRLVYRYVPQKLLDKPKRGFGVPIDFWLRNNLKNWALDRLSDKSSFDGLPINQKAALDLFNLHLSGKRNSHPLLWAILMLLEFNSRQISHD